MIGAIADSLPQRHQAAMSMSLHANIGGAFTCVARSNNNADGIEQRDVGPAAYRGPIEGSRMVEGWDSGSGRNAKGVIMTFGISLAERTWGRQ